ncbi:hypothetical protein [Rickettsia canadensis]|nr:hypothetical protein [Rickettsia canadensis]
MFNCTPPCPINPAPINIKGGVRFDDADPKIYNSSRCMLLGLGVCYGY